jgi:acyl carrier protein
MDDLRKIYGIDSDDLEECLGELLHKLGLEMPHSGELLKWNDSIETVKDILRFCQWVRLIHVT